MKRSRTFINGLILTVFALFCLAAIEYLAINIGQSNPLSSAYTLHAVFNDADGVPPAGDVRVSGVDVGKVTRVDHDPRQPGMTVVTMTISDSRATPVYTNGFAKIQPKTLLGDKFVNLTVGNSTTAAPIDSGGYLAVGQTGKTVSSDEIFNALNDPATKKDQQQVWADLDAATKGQSGNIQQALPQLQQLLADLEPVARMYSADATQGDRILVQLNTILQTTADEHEQLAGLLANGNVALGAIAQRDDALIATLQEASNVTTEFNAAMAPTVQAQRQALQELAPSLNSQNALLNTIVGPQQACGGRSCGIDQVFTGTLQGQIHYPSDQLTITVPEGEQTTNEWQSMFSLPPRGGGQHSALNLVLSPQCDTGAPVLQAILGNPSAPLQQSIIKTCQQLHGAGA